MSDPFAPPPPPMPPPIDGGYSGLPPAPPPPGGGASSRATTALVLGIVAIVCCQLAGPVAWYLGSAELKAIRAGAAPMAGEGLAKAGWILGIVGTVLLGLALIWILFMGGMVFLSALAASTGGG